MSNGEIKKKDTVNYVKMNIKYLFMNTNLHNAELFLSFTMTFMLKA